MATIATSSTTNIQYEASDNSDNSDNGDNGDNSDIKYHMDVVTIQQCSLQRCLQLQRWLQ